MVKLVSIDSSTSCTGWALFRDGKLDTSNCINLSKSKIVGIDKVRLMSKQILEMLAVLRPDIVVIEETMVTRNALAQRYLTMLLGVVLAWCIKCNAQFELVKPTVWRKYVKTEGEKVPRKREELKEWSVNKVQEIYNLSVSDDQSDAILIGRGYIKMLDEIQE